MVHMGDELYGLGSIVGLLVPRGLNDPVISSSASSVERWVGSRLDAKRDPT
jgi:hypothetical protein